jgi:hypothetical protein
MFKYFKYIFSKSNYDQQNTMLINDSGGKLSKSNILVILLLFGSSGRAGSIETPL